MKNKKAEAKKLLHELRESISKRPSPFAGMTEKEVIEQLRKTRKKLWEKKLAHVGHGKQAFLEPHSEPSL